MKTTNNKLVVVHEFGLLSEWIQIHCLFQVATYRKITVTGTALCRLCLTQCLLMWSGLHSIYFQNNVPVAETSYVFLSIEYSVLGDIKATGNLKKAKIIRPQAFINFWES
jgi:hypothetical protein